MIQFPSQNFTTIIYHTLGYRGKILTTMILNLCSTSETVVTGKATYLDGIQ